MKRLLSQTVQRVLITIGWFGSGLAATMSAAQAPLPDDRELLDILTHIDKWHLDDTLHFQPDDDARITLWLQPDNRQPLDGDDSDYLALYVPELDLMFQLKRPDYTIAELNATVNAQHYKVTGIRSVHLESPPQDAVIRMIDEAVLREQLYASRHSPTPLSPQLENRLNRFLTDLAVAEGIPQGGTQSFFIAPTSTYSNDLWIYWENAKQLIHLASDMPLEADAYWWMAHHRAEIFDLDEDVVTTLHKVPGSTSYVPRQWAARILFLCVVEGNKLTLQIKPQADERHD